MHLICVSKWFYFAECIMSVIWCMLHVHYNLHSISKYFKKSYYWTRTVCYAWHFNKNVTSVDVNFCFCWSVFCPNQYPGLSDLQKRHYSVVHMWCHTWTRTWSQNAIVLSLQHFEHRSAFFKVIVKLSKSVIWPNLLTEFFIFCRSQFSIPTFALVLCALTLGHLVPPQARFWAGVRLTETGQCCTVTESSHSCLQVKVTKRAIWAHL